MQIARYRPLRELSTFGDQMNRLFGDFLRPDATLGLLDQNWTPPLDVAETETAFLVKAELPGLEAANLDISFDKCLEAAQTYLDKASLPMQASPEAGPPAAPDRG